MISISGKYRVFMASIIANLAYLATGICVGWTSPVTPKLRDHTYDSPLNSRINEVQEGWVGSSMAIGGIIGCPVGGILSTRIGRKWTLLLSALFFAAAFTLSLVATNIWYIYVSRVLQGFASGFICTVMPAYIAEIASDDTRGPAGSLMTLFNTLGIIYVYSIGPYVSYSILQWCCLAVPVVFSITFFFMPETPYYFAMKNRKSAGLRSLQFLRCESKDSLLVQDEMIRIQSEVDADMANTGTFVDIIQNRVYRKVFIICCVLLAFQELSGTSAVTYNSQTIFTSAKSELDPALASIILGLVQLVANLVTPFVIDRAGRKLILMISAIGMSASLLALGTFFYIQAVGDSSKILWIPIPALVLYNALYSVGFGPVAWVVMGEILPSNIKSTVSSFATTLNWICTFIIARWYPELNALGPHYAFWMFSMLNALAFLFVLFFVMETKGLSLQKIQDKLHGK